MGTVQIISGFVPNVVTFSVTVTENHIGKLNRGLNPSHQPWFVNFLLVVIGPKGVENLGIQLLMDSGGIGVHRNICHQTIVKGAG